MKYSRYSSNKYHSTLSNYFLSKPLWLAEEDNTQPNIRKLVEQPWQQTKAALWDDVTETLCNLDFIQAKAVAKMTYELVGDFNAALLVIPDNQENIREENKRQARMDKYTQDLIACAKGEITRDELEVPESITPWTKEQYTKEIDRLKTNSTRLDRLKDFLNFLGSQSAYLQNYAHEIAHFVFQQAWNYSADGPVGKAAEKGSPEIYKTLLLRSPLDRPPWNPMPQSLQTLRRHTDKVTGVSITPDGKRAVSSSEDKTCIVWDLTTGEALQTLRGHTDKVTGVSITPDGKRAVSGSDDETCIVWDLTTSEVLQTLRGHTSCVEAVSITPDGKRAVSGSLDETCIVWDLTMGEALQTLRGHTDKVTAVSITPDGKRAVSGSHDETCIVWDLTTGELLQTLRHLSYVEAVSITPDGQRAAVGVGSREKTCILWDLTTGEALQTLRGHFVEAVSITADSKRALYGSRGDNLILRDLTMGEALQTLRGHTDKVTAVSITPDGKTAISGSDDRTCIVWDLTTSEDLQTFKHNSFGGMGGLLSITPDGKKGFSGTRDVTNTCTLWDLTKGVELQSLRGHTEIVQAGSITPDGKRGFSGCHGGTCILWDLTTGEALQTLRHTGIVSSVSITADGKRAVSGTWDNTCILWDLATGELLQTLRMHTSFVNSVSITADGKLAVSASNDKTCILWDLTTGEALQTLRGHNATVYAVSITPDGKKAVSGSLDETCIVWDLTMGEALQTLRGHTDKVTAVSITADGKLAVSGSRDNACILWDLESGEILTRLVLRNAIESIAFFPNGIVACSLWEVIILNANKQLLRPGRGIVTCQQKLDLELQQNMALSADCPLCCSCFAPPQSVLDTIENITKKAGLKPVQSPCLELPKEAWEDPGLLGNCPSCGEQLKFNPFVAGGGDFKMIDDMRINEKKSDKSAQSNPPKTISKDEQAVEQYEEELKKRREELEKRIPGLKAFREENWSLAEELLIETLIKGEYVNDMEYMIAICLVNQKEPLNETTIRRIVNNIKTVQSNGDEYNARKIREELDKRIGRELSAKLDTAFNHDTTGDVNKAEELYSDIEKQLIENKLIAKNLKGGHLLAKFLNNYGSLLVGQNRFKEAEPKLINSTHISPSYVNPWYWLAKLYQNRKNENDQQLEKNAWEKYLKLAPTSEDKKIEAENRLKELS